MRTSRTRYALFALACSISSCTCAPDRPATPEVRRRHLVTLPENYKAKSIFISDDGEEAVYTVREEAGDRLVQGGAAGPLLKEIGAPRMAPKSRRVFYWALDAIDGRRAIFLGADGKQLSTGYGRTGELVFSRDGARWAAIGGIEIDHGDGRRERGPVLMFADGQHAGTFADASLPVFSPDGAHVAQLIEEADHRLALLVDGEVRRRFEPPPSGATPPMKSGSIGPNLTQQYQLRYLSDGSLLTVASDADGWAVFRGDTRLASYPINVWNNRQGNLAFQVGDVFRTASGFVPSMLATARDAPVAAWWIREAGDAERWRVVRDGVPEAVTCARYWDVEPPVLSADGRHVAYACHQTTDGQPDQVEVIFDRQRFGPYSNVWGITLSADGKRIAFGADGGAPERPWFYVVDGTAHGLRFDRVFPPRFSPDGKHVAWVAERHGRLVLFLDGDGYASSDDLLWAPTFELGKGLSWAVLRGRRVSRIDIPLE